MVAKQSSVNPETIVHGENIDNEVAETLSWK